jgi:hypothetical protein
MAEIGCFCEYSADRAIKAVFEPRYSPNHPFLSLLSLDAHFVDSEEREREREREREKEREGEREREREKERERERERKREREKER